MSTQPQVRVSYLITTRNRAEFLQRTLDNVREFITPEDELIIFDAASTDDTPKVIERNKDIVSLFVSEPDRGEAHGFNKAILASSGRIIKFLTDDDYFYPEAMHRLIEILDSSPEIDALISGGEAYVFDKKTKEPKLLKYSYLPPEYSLIDNFNLNLNFVFCGLGFVLKRKAIEVAGLLDTSFISVDLEYIARLTFSSLQFKYANINSFKHYRHPHSSSLSFEHAQNETCRLKLKYPRFESLEKIPVAEVCSLLNLPHSKYNLAIGDFIKTLFLISNSKIKFLIPVVKKMLQTTLSIYSMIVSKYYSFRNKIEKNSLPVSYDKGNSNPIFDGSIR
jgi:glycosyltransferase involved in cell wall biosynthesis